MKFSITKLKQIIREELETVLESVPEPSPAVGPRYNTLKSSNIEDEEIDPHDPHRQHKYKTEKPDGIPGVSLALTEDENLDPERREKYIRRAIVKWMDKEGRQPNQHELGDLRYEFGELYDAS